MMGGGEPDDGDGSEEGKMEERTRVWMMVAWREGGTVEVDAERSEGFGSSGRRAGSSCN